MYVSADVTTGYWNRPDADRNNFTPDRKWYKSGDAGYFDSDGLFYVIDRLKEVIQVGKNKVSPSELESILLSHVNVSEAAVIGVKDKVWGEVPKAFVVPINVNHPPCNQTLATYVNEKSAEDYKKMRAGVYLIQNMPKIAFGKVNRTLLRQHPEKLKYLKNSC